MNIKLHAVTDEKGRPIRFFMSAGQVSDYTGAAALLDGFPSRDQKADSRVPNNNAAERVPCGVALGQMA